MMEYGMIFAMDRNNLIGKGNELPWMNEETGRNIYGEDFTHFQRETWIRPGVGTPIIMGRLTYESLPGGAKITGQNRHTKKLSQRTNIVLTRNSEYEPVDDRVHVCSTLDEALDLATKVAGGRGLDRIWCIGGKQIYELFEPHATVLEVTHINAEHEGDVYMEMDFSPWGVVNEKKSRHPDLTYKTYRRVD